MNTLWSMWKEQPYKLHGTCYTIKGFSIAALRSNFFIPEIKVMFDAGLSANLSPDYILVTHCHSDHTANLPYHLYNSNGKKIAIFAPPESYVRINNYIKGAYLMSLDIEDEDLLDVTKMYDMIPAYEGMTEININGKPMKMEIIKCTHSVPCVGYGLIERRLKLKPEYAHLQGKEIGALKKSGIDINYEVDFPFFCYLGDTSQKVLENPTLEKYINIMVECTFILPDEHDQAILTNHMHWEYLKPYVVAHPNNNFILYHFSQRYKPDEIKEFFDKEFNPTDPNNANKITNVHVWISS